MVGRRRRAVWGAVAAVLLVAGCGSGGSSGSVDRPVLSAGTASESSDPASPSGSPADSASRSPEEESATPTPSAEESGPEASAEESSPAGSDDSSDGSSDAGSDAGSGSGAAADGPSGSYDVTITGVAGGRSFSRRGTVRILGTISEVGTTNGVNAVDVCLISGSPAARPEVGAIWFGSNSGCSPGASAAHLDLAYVEVSGSTVTVQPDQRIAATLGNHYTVSSGLAACPFAPVSGSMRVTASGGRLTGRVDITGYGGAFCGQSRYQADLEGGS
jgi:hypothetical protein